MNEELELYKLCCDGDLVTELGWVSETEFYVWVSYFCLEDFMRGLGKICGPELFDDGGFEAYMQTGGVCIDLTEAVGWCIDLEAVFPKEKYKH